MQAKIVSYKIVEQINKLTYLGYSVPYMGNKDIGTKLHIFLYLIPMWNIQKYLKTQDMTL